MRRLSVALLLASLFCSPPLAAQSAEDRATARDLADQGKTRLEAGDTRGALELFRRADALYPAPTLKLAVARALIKLGDLAEAAALLRDVAMSKADPKEPEAWSKAREAAAAEAEALRPRIPTLELSIKGPASPVVLLDGKPYPAAALGVARAINPGTHKIEASADGWERGMQEISLKEGERKKIELSLKQGVSAPASSNAPAASNASSAPTVAPTAPRHDKPRSAPVAGYVLGGVGAVALGVGAYFGLRTFSKKSERDDLCPGGRCTQQAGVDADNAARSSATISTVAMPVGLALVGAAIYLLVTHDDKPTSSASRPWFNGVSVAW